MIIQNGTIQIKEKVGGGIDPKTGHPIRPNASFGDAIACQYLPNKYNTLATSKGEHFTQAEYQVLLDDDGQPFTAEQIRLTDRSGKVLGEFSVMQIEPLEAVNQIRLWI